MGYPECYVRSIQTPFTLPSSRTPFNLQNTKSPPYSKTIYVVLKRPSMNSLRGYLGVEVLDLSVQARALRGLLLDRGRQVRDAALRVGDGRGLVLVVSLTPASDLNPQPDPSWNSEG